MNKKHTSSSNFSVLVYTAIRLYIQDKKNKHCQESKLTLVSAGEVQVAMESVDVY